MDWMGGRKGEFEGPKIEDRRSSMEDGVSSSPEPYSHIGHRTLNPQTLKPKNPER